jgi:hypothetical protein
MQWRPLVLLAGALLSLLIFTLSFNLFFICAVNQAPLAERIVIMLPDLAQEDEGLVTFNGISGTGRKIDLERLERNGRKNIWTVYNKSLVRSINMVVDPALLGDMGPVRIGIGETKFYFSQFEIEKEWVRKAPISVPGGKEFMVFGMPPEISLKRAPIPGLGSAINWAGNRKFLWSLIDTPIPMKNLIDIILVFFLAFLFVRLFPGVLGFLLDSSRGADGEESAKWDFTWALAGLGAVVAGFFYLEWKDFCYFSQDDNLAQFLPVILQGCRSLWDGVFPTWNPFQFMGMPTTSMGTYALTYPVTYTSYFVARHLLGNEYLTIEVFAFIHFTAGFVFTYMAVRQAGVRPMLAAAASISCVFAGYNLLAGRSWYYMLPILAWMPLLVLSIIRLQKGPVDWKWVLWTGFAAGAFFHGGNVQMWAYAMVFYLAAAALLTISQAIPVRRLFWTVPALLWGLALSSPLLVPLMLHAARITRTPCPGNGIGMRGIIGMILPFPLFRTSHAEGWGNAYWELMGHIYYAGTLFALVALAGAFVAAGFLIAHRWDGTARRVVSGNVWLLMAILTLLLLMGKAGLLWEFMSLLPGFSKFRFPFKFLAFINLFFSVGAGVILERILASARNPRRVEAVICGVVALLMAYHLSMARPSFYTYGDDPYPPPSKIFSQVRYDGTVGSRRVLPFAPKRSLAPGYALSLEHNFPSVYGVLALEGYDFLITGSEEFSKIRQYIDMKPVSAMEAYGAGWVLVHRLTYDTFLSRPVWESAEKLAEKNEFVLEELLESADKVASDENLDLWRLKSSDPMAFVRLFHDEPLPVKFDGAGASVSLPAGFEGGDVVVNVLCWPEMKAVSGGRALTVKPDEWSRVVVEVPEGARSFRLDYRPPWKQGFVAAGVMIYLAMAAYIVVFKKCRE